MDTFTVYVNGFRCFPKSRITCLNAAVEMGKKIVGSSGRAFPSALILNENTCKVERIIIDDANGLRVIEG